MRTRLLLLLLALLPGLALAGVADVRLCLDALAGADGCCNATESAAPSCCPEQQAPPGERARTPVPECAFCCLVVESQDVELQGAAPGDPLSPTLAWASTAALPAWNAPAPVSRTLPLPERPPPRPGVAAKLPLRI